MVVDWNSSNYKNLYSNLPKGNAPTSEGFNPIRPKGVSNGRSKIKLAVLLLLLGFIGVASLLATEIPMSPEIEELMKSSNLSIMQIKLLSLVNPSLLLLISVAVGVSVYQQAGLRASILEKVAGFRNITIDGKGIIIHGVLFGVLAGAAMAIISLVSVPHLVSKHPELAESPDTSFVTAILYGGITEEILLRFGLMSFVSWLCYELFKATASWVYWLAIVLSSLVFGLGHLPIVFSSVQSPGLFLVSYIVLINSVGGVFFGYAYWKKGLECAMLAHIFTHVVIAGVGLLLA